MFKFFAAIVATALTVSSVASQSHIRSVNGDSMLHERSLEAQATATATTTKTWVNKLTPIANTNKYHMKPVRAIHTRVQADAPAWDPTNKIFTSKYGSTFEEKFRNAFDSVSTASVEGALMGVQTDGINYNLRSEANKCMRAGNIKYVVFYDVVFAQPNETLALYETEYGPYLPLASGKCDSSTKLCQSVNGDKGEPQIGPFIGKELKDSDPRAPYPNAYRFSFPNTAVTKPYVNKTEAFRNATRRGLCAFDKLPDGVTCTYNYRIAGFVPLDDVVGITAMRNKANTSTYKSFGEFCKDGRVEFNTTGENGTWIESINFWRNPQSKSENAKRAIKLVSAYTVQLLVQKSAQIESTLIANTMTLLPTVAQLTASNPPCYLNIKECSGPYGCKRLFYSQQCRVCTAMDIGCTVNVSEFVYPTLAKAVGSTSASSTEQANDGSGDDILLVVGIICGVLAIAALVAYRQRRRVREPKLKAMLLSASTRANDGSAPCILVEMATRLEKPSVAIPLTPTAADSESELK